MSKGKERLKAYKHTLLQSLRAGRVNCALCGKPIIHASDLTVDHLRPKAIGGKNDYNNMAPAHFACNQAKGQTIIDSLIYADFPVTDLVKEEKND